MNPAMAAATALAGFDPAAFSGAARSLALSLPQLYRMETDGETIIGPREGLIQRLLHSILILVVMRHVAYACPLKAPSVVVEAFRREGFEWDAATCRPHAGRLAQCVDCGYALPPEFTACPICEGAIGEFVYDGPGIRKGKLN